MTWQSHDNPHIRGAIDRVFVSRTEYWEVHHFVDHYLNSNNYALTDANRALVRTNIAQYPGRAPVQRDDLTRFLNGRFGK